MRNDKLIRARRRKGWTQEELSRLISCEKSTISNWENGVSNPSLSTAFRLSSLLECDVNELFLNIKIKESQKMNQSKRASVNNKSC
ncbi:MULTISPECIES: helix-turn-helix transcriptional regulator [unclassified Sporolactobacillus]|uniref:helix-turn-helix transcriptional regulator n=1 Tax=unclassified Sporolactobacillus TaxID=2628533 RepID=UPI0023684017|nr:helix-turn-helix transcriptional regulator [Sporolactobacillus sp. CQH2019]MDD9149699.1 helix-turn-helix transcriptional regulator [Sporolactobacillus sp. CQH2019]